MRQRRALTIILLLMLIGLLSALAGVLFGLVKLPEFITSSPLVALLLVGVALGGLGYWLYRAQLPDETLPLRKQNRQRMLGRVRTRITKQRNDSLQGAPFLALGLHVQPNSVVSYSPFSLQLTDQPTQPVPSQSHIFQAYQEAEGQLLILVELGAGKTTLLLDLAYTLLEQAERDESVPMPIIFNLASWAVKRQPLADWLVEELALIYQVPRQLGKSWIEADELQPLLDGLDEVAQAQRSACVDAMNTYRGQHGLLPTVVCCRQADYFHQPRRLRLRSAVVVEPLSKQQIDERLSHAGESLAGLRQALATEPSLQALAPIPLMLNLMILAYQDQSVDQIVQPFPPSTRQQQVLNDYVQRRLHRRSVTIRYTAEQTKHALAWLALQMTQHQQAEMYLERIQPDWLPDARSSRQYERLASLTIGLAYGLVLGLTIGLAFGWGGHVLFGLGAGLLFGLVGIVTGGHFEVVHIEPAEALTWSWKRFWKNYLHAPAYVTLGKGLGGALVVGLESGWSSSRVDTSRLCKPNQGIWQSARNSVRVLLGLGLLVGLSFGLPFGLSNGLGVGLLFGVSFGLCFGMPFGLKNGGRACIQHVVLRLLLRQTGCTPRRYVDFLDYAADCILLRKVGGGYCFVHRLLQDYFAALSTKPVAPSGA